MKERKLTTNDITHEIIASAIEVHRRLGPGLLENCKVDFNWPYSQQRNLDRINRIDRIGGNSLLAILSILLILSKNDRDGLFADFAVYLDFDYRRPFIELPTDMIELYFPLLRVLCASVFQKLESRTKTAEDL